MGGPARGYRWEAFGEGNTAARTHGLYQAGRAEQIRARVEELAAAVADSHPWTAGFEAERLAFARACVDEADLRAYLDTVGPLDEHGEERSAVRTLEKFSARAARCRAALGLSPASAAVILRNMAEVVRKHPCGSSGALAQPLAALMIEGRRALERGTQGRENVEGES
ncbi:MAG TPA: hypothetical protein VMF35_11575 [Acidimicrobiales bacterium]|nr:hypothetical protein [Acidimicrobiales bacterium]